MSSYVGKLLISPPTNKETFFEKSLVLIYDQTPKTTTGVIVNKPSNRTLQELCEFNDIEYRGKERIFIGGPVNPSALLMLHSRDWACTNTIEIGNHWRVSSDHSMLTRIAKGDRPRYWRLCLGMCGWSPGQLEGEILGAPPWSRSKSWLVSNPTTEILFHRSSSKVWTKAIENCGQEMIDSFFTI